LKIRLASEEERHGKTANFLNYKLQITRLQIIVIP